MRRRHTFVKSKGHTNTQKNNHFKIVQPENIETGFDDIIGHQECKKELNTLLEFLNCPEKYLQYGISPYCKYLLIGESGVGKSTLAYSIAKSSNFPIVVVEPSFFFNTEEILTTIDSLFSMVSCQIENAGNCILLFKEVEYITTLCSEVKQPLIEKLLGFFRNLPQLVAFATVSFSFEVEIHKLLIQKPAFEKIIQLFSPELKVREEIIRKFLGGLPVDSGLNIHRLALDTYQMTTGDIKKLVNDAALFCLQNGQTKLSYQNFAETLAQSEFGYVKNKLNESERLATARHEAGHVIAGYFSAPDTYKVSKVEITPRSFYLGITQQIADEEKKGYFKEDLENQIILCLGGMASEDYYYHSTTSGVANDLEQATILAIGIHKIYGMSSEVGPICLTSDCFFSEALNASADILIQRFLKQMYERTKKIIEQHSDALEELIQTLLSNEVVYSEEVMAILGRYTK